jgi:hypothetical protein
MDITLSPDQVNLLTGISSFFFTVALFSYLIGDNPLYRLALHIFIGVSVGYATLIVIYQVLQPRLIEPLKSGDFTLVALASVPLMLFLFLIMKINPRTSALGNSSVAYLIGVGTAVAVGGAITGTLLPQIRSTWVSLMPGSSGKFVDDGIIALGTVTTLLAFQYWLRGRTSGGEVKRVAILRFLSTTGQIFVVITLGVVYGGIILSGIAIFSHQLMALYDWAIVLVP